MNDRRTNKFFMGRTVLFHTDNSCTNGLQHLYCKRVICVLLVVKESQFNVTARNFDRCPKRQVQVM